MILDQGIDGWFVTQQTRVDQSFVGWTSVHQDAERFCVSELARDLMRRPVRAQRPDVNASAALGILLWEKLLVNAYPNAFRLGVEMLAD